MGRRETIVELALWGVAHEPDIHYRQSRPIDGIDEPRKLPLYTDCSGFVTDLYQWAGAPDPNGRGFDGLGYTGTFLTALEHVDAGEIKVGDPIVFGPGGGDHVVVVIETGPDPMVVSHGQEAGPLKTRLSAQIRAHRPPVTYLRGAGLDNVEPTEEDDGMTDEERVALFAAVARLDNAVNDPKYGILARTVTIETKIDSTEGKVDALSAEVGVGSKTDGLVGSLRRARRIAKMIASKVGIPDAEIAKSEDLSTD